MLRAPLFAAAIAFLFWTSGVPTSTTTKELCWRPVAYTVVVALIAYYASSAWLFVDTPLPLSAKRCCPVCEGCTKRPEERRQITRLDKVTVSEFVTDSGRRMVLVFADWCGHCKVMMPDFADVVKKTPGVTFGMIEASDLPPGFADRYRVHAYPTSLLFEGGVQIASRTGRLTAIELSRFVVHGENVTDLSE